MPRPLKWTRERVLDALRAGEPVAWSIIIKYWRTLTAARVEAGIPLRPKRINRAFARNAAQQQEEPCR